MSTDLGGKAFGGKKFSAGATQLDYFATAVLTSLASTWAGTDAALVTRAYDLAVLMVAKKRILEQNP